MDILFDLFCLPELIWLFVKIIWALFLAFLMATVLIAAFPVLVYINLWPLSEFPPRLLKSYKRLWDSLILRFSPLCSL